MKKIGVMAVSGQHFAREDTEELLTNSDSCEIKQAAREPKKVIPDRDRIDIRLSTSCPVDVMSSHIFQTL